MIELFHKLPRTPLIEYVDLLFFSIVPAVSKHVCICVDVVTVTASTLHLSKGLLNIA